MTLGVSRAVYKFFNSFLHYAFGLGLFTRMFFPCISDALQGAPSGEAFIQMDSDGSAEAAAAGRHNRLMQVLGKKRTVEVLQCSGDDMMVVLSQGLIHHHQTPATIAMAQASFGGLLQPAGKVLSPTGPTFWPPTATAGGGQASAITAQFIQQQPALMGMAHG